MRLIIMALALSQVTKRLIKSEKELDRLKKKIEFLETDIRKHERCMEREKNLVV